MCNNLFWGIQVYNVQKIKRKLNEDTPPNLSYLFKLSSEFTKGSFFWMAQKDPPPKKNEKKSISLFKPSIWLYKTWWTWVIEIAINVIALLV